MVWRGFRRGGWNGSRQDQGRAEKTRYWPGGYVHHMLSRLAEGVADEDVGLRGRWRLSHAEPQGGARGLVPPE